ncbi:hypothetical protein ACHAWF_003666 [Thalassiosira exigua]
MMVPMDNNNERDLLGSMRDMFNMHENPAVAGQQRQQSQAQSAASTGDLLGLGPPPQQQQRGVVNANHATEVINAEHATISISTCTAPTIAGLGKIDPTVRNNNNNNVTKRKVIRVPTYSCNGGLDTKFNHYARHARPSDLHNLLTPEEYEREIRTLNDKIKKARANSLDVALLATGPLLVPLAVWGARHGRQVKRRRTLIEEGVWEFNERMGMDGRNVRMVWNRAKVAGGGESYLTIEEADDLGGDKGSKKFD